jgi:hypothetical protein
MRDQLARKSALGPCGFRILGMGPLLGQTFPTTQALRLITCGGKVSTIPSAHLAVFEHAMSMFCCVMLA